MAAGTMSQIARRSSSTRTRPLTPLPPGRPDECGRASINAGFGRVFWTMVDTHVAALISSAFLFQFGTGPIRGFATTLVFGLASNLFTSIFVSKTLYEAALSGRHQVATLSI